MNHQFPYTFRDKFLFDFLEFIHQITNKIPSFLLSIWTIKREKQQKSKKAAESYITFFAG